MSRLRPKLTYSNAIASIALFVALSGVAVAATNLPRNSVGPNQLKRGAVTAAKIRKGAVGTNKLANKAVKAGKLGPDAVLPGNIVNGGVNTHKIANGAVRATNIHNNVVTTNKLNNNAVTNQKLALEAVGAGNLQANAVGPANMRVNSVGTETLQNGAVTAAKLGSDVGPVLGTLKSGQTLRGVFDIGGEGTEGTEVLRGSQSYPFPLLSTPAASEANIVEDPKSPTAACPGLSGGLEQTPLAAPGNLCVYITAEELLKNLKFDSGASNRLGFGLIAEFTTVAGGFVQGQWAVTAP